MLKKTSEGEGCHETKRVSRVDSRDRGYGFAVTGSRTESGGGESRAVNSRSETSAFEFRLRRHRRHCASDRRTPPIRPRFRRRVYAREPPRSAERRVWTECVSTCRSRRPPSHSQNTQHNTQQYACLNNKR